MEMIQQLLVSVVTSGITATIIAFLSSTIVKRYVDRIFKEQEVRAEAKIKAELSASEALFDRELAIYPEVTEVLYRCRNLARDCLSESTRTRKTLTEFSRYAIHLNGNVYKYRLFFSDESFRKIHRFKTEIQEYSILLNEITRSTEVEDAPPDPRLQAIAKEQMQNRYQTINELYQLIIPEIQNIIHGKAAIGTDR